MAGPNAVELTVEVAWAVAETVGAGSFPWVLAVTPPARPAERAELLATGVLSERTGQIDPAVAEWFRTVCHPERWLEIRCVATCSNGSHMLRGIAAFRGERCVVAYRNAQLITFTTMVVTGPADLVPIVTAGLTDCPPAALPAFVMPAHVGARADEQLRGGARPAALMDYLGIPAGAREVIRSALEGPRRYVEVVAGRNNHGQVATSEVGLAVIDTTGGRLVVSAEQAPDGKWLSTFASGDSSAIARGVDALTAVLPAGGWFVPVPI